LKHLDLFSGIGGFALAAKWAGFETVGFCEIEEYPRKVLGKNFPGVPIHQDIRELDGAIYEGIDIITGGYPCQPFSTAGKRKGQEDDRHLWPEMLRVITQARPSWVIAENVTGHVTMGLDSVLTDLESEGYAARPVVIPAIAVDAKHRRDRVWILGSNPERLRSAQQEREYERAKKCNGSGENELAAGAFVGDTKGIEWDEKQTKNSSYRGARLQESAGRHGGSSDGGIWIPEPSVGRVVDGLQNRVDRIKSLGNAIVPQVAYQILSAIRMQG